MVYRPGFDSASVTGKLLGLFGNLGMLDAIELLLDAGDENSYAGSGTQWSDISGNGRHFSSSGGPPTFNGTPGAATEAEYWAFPGGARFQSNAALDFAAGWQQSGAQYSTFAMFYSPLLTSARGLLGFDATAVILNSDEDVSLSTSGFTGIASSNTFAANAWTFVFTSVHQGGGEVSFLRLNTTVVVDTESLSASANAPATYFVASNSSGANQLLNGSRMAGVAVWNKLFTQEEVDSFYTLLKAIRFTSLP